MRFIYTGVVSGVGTIVDRETVHGRKVSSDKLAILIEEMDKEEVDHLTYKYPLEVLDMLLYYKVFVINSMCYFVLHDF